MAHLSKGYTTFDEVRPRLLPPRPPLARVPAFILVARSSSSTDVCKDLRPICPPRLPLPIGRPSSRNIGEGAGDGLTGDCKLCSMQDLEFRGGNTWMLMSSTRCRRSRGSLEARRAGDEDAGDDNEEAFGAKVPGE